MHTQEKKDKFWKEHAKVGRNRNVYRVLGYICYPFINRSKVREKVYKGTANWYTKRLWYMLNDDELSRYSVDYDVEMVKEKKPHYNLETDWGRFKASYWFNALRNSAYNYLLSYPPYDAPVKSYEDREYPIDDIEGGSIDEDSLIGERVDPLERAEWIKFPNGNINWDKSKIGEGEVWYHPNGDKSVSLCRYSRAYIKKFLFWNFYITKKKGEFNGGRKYDSHYKLAKIERR